MTARSSVALLVLALAGAFGCYNPTIAEGGLRCAPGRVCPDHFQCAPDGRCYSARDAGRDTGADATCTLATPASTCARPAPSGQACNLACQWGCGCGSWCAVVSGAATCVTGTPPGTKAIGDVCDPAKTADCAPGLFCHGECGTGRCYKHCETGADCAGTTCTVAGGTLCALPPPSPSCDPVGKTGCPPGYGCYPTGMTPYCDCPGTVAPGGSCMFAHECQPGYGCAGPKGAAVCQKLCKMNSDCGTLGVCTAVANDAYCL